MRVPDPARAGGEAGNWGRGLPVGEVWAPAHLAAYFGVETPAL